jgi:hypothetical protein
MPESASADGYRADRCVECLGEVGHGLSAYEQKTQQSPDFGLIGCRHAGHCQ